MAAHVAALSRAEGRLAASLIPQRTTLPVSGFSGRPSAASSPSSPRWTAPTGPWASCPPHSQTKSPSMEAAPFDCGRTRFASVSQAPSDPSSASGLFQVVATGPSGPVPPMSRMPSGAATAAAPARPSGSASSSAASAHSPSA